MRRLVVTDADRALFPELKKQGHHTFGGFDHDFHRRVYRDCRPEQCTKAFKEIWTDGSLRFSDGSFEELFLEGDVNEEISEFVREKVRVRVKDTEIADKLMPTTHGFSLDRVPPETKYRDDVGFVDVDTALTVNFTETVLKTEEDEYDFDVIILPTGFDFGSGALARMNIPGRDGCSVTER